MRGGKESSSPCRKCEHGYSRHSLTASRSTKYTARPLTWSSAWFLSFNNGNFVFFCTKCRARRGGSGGVLPDFCPRCCNHNYNFSGEVSAILQGPAKDWYTIRPPFILTPGFSAVEITPSLLIPQQLPDRRRGFWDFLPPCTQKGYCC